MLTFFPINNRLFTTCKKFEMLTLFPINRLFIVQKFEMYHFPNKQQTVNSAKNLKY